MIKKYFYFSLRTNTKNESFPEGNYILKSKTKENKNLTPQKNNPPKTPKHLDSVRRNKAIATAVALLENCFLHTAIFRFMSGSCFVTNKASAK